MPAGKMKEAEKAGLEKTFKLKTSISTSSMVLFDADGKIAKYNSALDILKEFCGIRRQVYVRRKEYLVAKMTREKEILSNKARFILMVVKGELEIRKKKKDDLLKELLKKGFKPMSELNAIMEGHGDIPDDDDKKSGEKASKDDASAEKTDYDYLLGMNLWSLTFEKVEEIKKQLEVKTEELKVLQKTSVEQFWDRDLEALSQALNEIDVQDAADEAAAASATESRKRKAGA